jgi:metallo-beta-lactamase family protein
LAYIQFLGQREPSPAQSIWLIFLVRIEASGAQLLADCGLFQGKKEWRERNWHSLPVPAEDIDGLLLTHAHIDHCGWIPRLVKQGFRGAIYATQATIDLCRILLPDSGHLQEQDAAYHNKRKSSRHHPALPLYTAQEAEVCLRYFPPIAFDHSEQISPDVSFRFVHAAHILASAKAEITISGYRGNRPVRLLFAGDIGRI